MTLIVGIDTETTELETDAGVCQLAVVLLDTETWQLTERLSYLVNPQKPISPASRRIHGISDGQVKDSPTLAEVLNDPKLQACFDMPVVFGHNVGFDIRMVGRDRFAHAQVLDTLSVLRTCFPQWRSHRLGQAAEQLGLNLNNAHDALADIEATAQILSYFHHTYGYSLERMLEISGGIKQHFLDK